MPQTRCEWSKEATIALQEVPLLQEEVQSLKADNIGLKEEMWALITTLNTALTRPVTKVTAVSATVKILTIRALYLKIWTPYWGYAESHHTYRAPNADAIQRNSGSRGHEHRSRRQKTNKQTKKKQTEKTVVCNKLQCKYFGLMNSML